MENSLVEFESACHEAVAIQKELLGNILLKNCGCEYLQRYGAPLELESFKSQVPLISYDDIQQDIQRVADGSTQPILCIDPVSQFAQTAGTSSGRQKIIPQTVAATSTYMKAAAAGIVYRNKYFQMESSKPLTMSFMYCAKEHETKSGLLAAPASTHIFKSEAFKQLNLLQRTSPYELIVAGSDWRQTTYCHLLCGLLQRHKVQIIHAIFAYMLCNAMRLLQTEWRNLCQDISTGTLNMKLVTDERLRSIMSKVFERELGNQNAKKLAEEISGICSSDSWHGIVTLLWPRAKYVHTVVTGAMQLYVPALMGYAGDLPLVCCDYGCSEASIMGININHAVTTEEVVFTLSPFSAFFEFIPVDEDNDFTVTMEGLEVGKQYELVITTSHGLYRYKLGDVITIKGFFHQAPQVAFTCRKNTVLSLTGEKVHEQELQKAVLSSTPHNIEVADFTSCAEYGSEGPPHYVIFCEVRGYEEYTKDQALQEFCENIERSLQSNFVYLMGRVNKTIGPLELVLVKQATFENLMIQAYGASPGQYKTPRCVNSPTMLEHLKQGKVQSYRSV